ncbi:DUF2971 domain-containing protein [Sphingomonas sp. NPDC019816]|uniref:DUF2971 domain-containing protein n=1 Tax=Sphingomonas sp. NPDC019816 TaxID=3390679 RepID=UPI003CFC87B8
MAELKIYAKPSSLYRYRPLRSKAVRELRALRESFIYCPAYSAMNDPMEGLHRLSSRFAENRGSEKSRERVQTALQTMGIASMSEVHDHEPMWAHYADQFSGMCVQYSLNRLIKGLDLEIAITRMMYSEIEPVLLLDGSKSVDRARLCLSSKTVRWASEREWRIFMKEQGEASYGAEKAVTRIYLGSRVTQADEALVRATGREIGVPVSKMEIDKYAMSFKSPSNIRLRSRPKS